jgi:hypothetical protein
MKRQYGDGVAMSKRFQFSMGRLLLAMLFFSVTAFALSYLVLHDHYGDVGLPAAIFGAFASAGAGLGCLAGRARLGAALGLSVPLTLFLAGAMPLGLLLFCLGVAVGAAFIVIRQRFNR